MTPSIMPIIEIPEINEIKLFFRFVQVYRNPINSANGLNIGPHYQNIMANLTIMTKILHF